MGQRPTQGDVKTRCGKFGWQAEAPAPRWPEWGRRFRLPTGVVNGVSAFLTTADDIASDAPPRH